MGKEAVAQQHRERIAPLRVRSGLAAAHVRAVEDVIVDECRGVDQLHDDCEVEMIRRDFSFQQQVIENTNIKLILRQDDPDSVEKFVKIAGTRKTLIPTWQTEEKILGKGFTGTGSLREGQTFRVEPDLIRGLKRGEAVVIWKNPELCTDYVKLDFFGHNDYPGIFEPIRKEIKKEEPPAETKTEPAKLKDSVTIKESQPIILNHALGEPSVARKRVDQIAEEKRSKKF